MIASPCCCHACPGSRALASACSTSHTYTPRACNPYTRLPLGPLPVCVRQVHKVVKTRRAKALLVAPNVEGIEHEGGAGPEFPITSE